MQCLSPLFHSELFSTFSTSWTVFGWSSQSKGNAFFFFFYGGKFQNLLVECCGQTKQKTEKFTVHRCTQVQFESRNSSQRVMADCILWLSGGSLLQTRTNHYIMQWREYFWGDSLKLSTGPVYVESACVVCVCVGFLQVIQFILTVQTYAGELNSSFMFLWILLNESDLWWLGKDKIKTYSPPCASICQQHAISVMNIKLIYLLCWGSWRP